MSRILPHRHAELRELAAQITHTAPQCFAAFPADALPADWSRSLSALANTGGGTIYFGLTVHAGTLQHAGFSAPEDAQLVLRVLAELHPCLDLCRVELMQLSEENTWLLQVELPASRQLVPACDGVVYLRKGSRDVPCAGEDALQELLREKQQGSYEDTLSGYILEDILPSKALDKLLQSRAPQRSAYDFLRSQRMMNAHCQLTVAAVLLFASCPQALLPQRSGIRILRYRSEEREGSSDSLVEESLFTAEGDLRHLIRSAVERVQQIIADAGIVGSDGLRLRAYPARVLHELITNAVIHRDYSIQKDIQIRIFTNRIEIESPGTLPQEPRIRNPRLVRLLSLFPDAPNRNIGKGMRSISRAMREAGLQSPTMQQQEQSVIVTLKHERLADAERLVLDYLDGHDTISNSLARELTGITDANRMKQVFIRLKDKGLLQIVPGTRSTSTLWCRVHNGQAEDSDQISLFDEGLG